MLLLANGLSCCANGNVRQLVKCTTDRAEALTIHWVVNSFDPAEAGSSASLKQGRSTTTRSSYSSFSSEALASGKLPVKGKGPSAGKSVCPGSCALGCSSSRRRLFVEVASLQQLSAAAFSAAAFAAAAFSAATFSAAAFSAAAFPLQQLSLQLPLLQQLSHKHR